MRTIAKLMFVAIAGFAVAASPALAGITGFQANLASNGFGNGGAFNVTLRNNNPANLVEAGAPNNPAYYGTVPTNILFGTQAGKMTTFCVENVTFVPGTWYAASIDDTIQNGGGSNPDTLTSLTKSLFAEYVLGTTTAYGGQTLAQYVALNSTRNQALQNIFWGEQGTGLSNGGDAVATEVANILAGWGSANNIQQNTVKVLNLWGGPNPYQGDKQSHLVMVVPVPGAAVLCFMGLGLVGWVKRRLA